MQKLENWSNIDNTIAILAIVSFVSMLASLFVERNIKFLLEIPFYVFWPIALIYVFSKSIYTSKKLTKMTACILSSIVVVGLSLCYVYLLVDILVPKYKDIPNIMTSSYIVIEGYPSNISISGAKTRTQHFEINGADFSVEAYAFPNLFRNKKYRVTYLPNSEYVIDINEIK